MIQHEDPSMTIKEILKKSYEEFKVSPIDAEILLSLVLSRPKEFILAYPEKELSKKKTRKFFSFVRKRSTGFPIAYITGIKEFHGLEFFVNRNVLIPRPESELLVESALKKVLNSKKTIPNTIIDVGTGSGNLIISIVKNIPANTRNKINFCAIDVSSRSLIVAKENAKKNKVVRCIKFLRSDMLDNFLGEESRLNNIMVIANLPYVSSKIYHRNLKHLYHEPKTALFSPKEGLAHYKKLIGQISSIAAGRIIALLEISPEQKVKIGRIARKYLPNANLKYSKDLAGKWRIVEIELLR